MKKAIKDMFSMLYDSDGCMSSVRFGYFVCLALLVITWYMVLFKDKDTVILVSVIGAPALSTAQYLGKKYIECRRDESSDEENQ